MYFKEMGLAVGLVFYRISLFCSNHVSAPIFIVSDLRAGMAGAEVIP